MAPPLFVARDLEVAPSEHPDNAILTGVDLTVGEGELHAVMGPNGSGKSTLASTIMGSPEYTVTRGALELRGQDIATWATDDRARAGIFMAFQYPQEVSGVPLRQFLRAAMSARSGIEDLSILEVRLAMMEWMERLDIDPAFADRYLNEGFSGGEKKRNEILQMAMLEPDLAVLDETDSGLDIDALRIVAAGVSEVRRNRPQMGTIVITHYRRLLDELQPDVVHILVDGRIVETGDMSLAEQLDSGGFEQWRGRAA